jgi:tetratricopeptide (TPR) repeat protein
MLPVGCVLVARGMTLVSQWAADAIARSRATRSLRAGMPIAVGLSLLLAGIGLGSNWSEVQQRRQLEIAFVENMRQTGVWLGRHLPPGSTIAIATIGAISYYSGLNVIDMLGLTDREIARNPKMIEGVEDTWREIKYNAESVLRRAPDAILFSTGVRPSSASEKALFLYQSFYESYYGYYFRSEPWRRQIQSLFRRRADAPPFHPDLIEAKDSHFIDLYMAAHLKKSRESDHTEATRLFRQSAEEAPGFPWAREWLAVSIYDGKDTTGVEMLHDVVREDPYATIALGRLAIHYLRAGDLAQAERYLEAVRQVDPDDNLGWAGLARVRAQQGDHAAAYEFAKQGVILWDSNAGQLVFFGSLAAVNKRFEEAVWAYERAIALDPEGKPAEDARKGLQMIRARQSSGSGQTPEVPGGP